MRAGVNCDSIDYCADEPCLNAGTCTSEADDYTCRCTSGYRGDNCDENVDECAEYADLCLYGGTCVDLNGGYRCVSAAARIRHVVYLFSDASPVPVVQ